MSVDQVLYVAARINDWARSPIDVVSRATAMIKYAEYAVEVADKIPESVLSGVVEKADSEDIKDTVDEVLKFMRGGKR